jgi:hypothetical protein
MDFFLTSEMEMYGVSLPFYLCLQLDLCFYFVFSMFIKEIFLHLKYTLKNTTNPDENPDLSMILKISMKNRKSWIKCQMFVISK